MQGGTRLAGDGTGVTAFVSQKGGVGKSTLARALAREAAKHGLVTKIADLDTQQKTCVDWNCTRLGSGIQPSVSVEAFATAAQALKIMSGFDLLIIDGPARMSTATLEIARAADLVVQPTGPCTDDLKPAIREFHALVKAGIPQSRLVFALNMFDTASEEAQARKYIAEAGYTALEGSLSTQPAYRGAHNVGRAITETPFRTLNAKADALVQAIIDRMASQMTAEAA